MIRRCMLIFVAFVIIAAVINIPLAVIAIPPTQPPPKSPGLPLVVNVFDAEAVARGWPVALPPAAQNQFSPAPWPEVTQWSQEGSYFHRRRQAWSLNQSARTTHQMEIELYGWPLPALRRGKFWSSQDTSPRFDPSLQILDEGGDGSGQGGDEGGGGGGSGGSGGRGGQGGRGGGGGQGGGGSTNGGGGLVKSSLIGGAGGSGGNGHDGPGGPGGQGGPGRSGSGGMGGAGGGGGGGGGGTGGGVVGGGAGGYTETYLDTGLILHWPGVVANPLLMATGLWLIIIAPFVLWFEMRCRIRIRKGLCPKCAYPVGASSRCTECGFELPLKRVSSPH